MKRQFRLQGLDCANCAAKMQKDISSLAGVTAATVNHMTAKLVIEADDGQMAAAVAAAEKIVHKYEPDVIVKRA